MTLVMLGTLPFLALVGMILSKLTTLTTTKTEAAYTKASSHAQQAISQIRTVAAYHGEERSIQVRGGDRVVDEEERSLQALRKPGCWACK